MLAKYNETEKIKFSDIDLHVTIVEDGIQCVFPNVEIALRTLLALMITYCSLNSLFSTERNKYPQSTTMCQDRLDSLFPLHMEVDMIRQVSFD
jgi:hypothetical protein